MTTTKNIKLKYFAILREQAGKTQEVVTTEARTLADLYAEMKAKYPFHLSSTQLKFAANATFRAADYELCEGDEIVFIPPVAGG